MKTKLLIVAAIGAVLCGCSSVQRKATLELAECVVPVVDNATTSDIQKAFAVKGCLETYKAQMGK